MIHGALRDGRRRAANAPSTRFAFLCSRPTAWPSRAFTTSPAQGAKVRTSDNINAIKLPRTQKTRSRSAPREQACALTDGERLELCLPPHLRKSPEGYAATQKSFVPNAVETAELALEAFGGRPGLLLYLAIDQGRWRAAVWIVKFLVEHFHAQPTRSDRLRQTVQDWNRSGTLDDATEHPLYLVPRSGESSPPHIGSSSSASLHELTDDKPDNLSRMEILRHKILGLVWSEIGRLIILCSSKPNIAGGEVKPDVLEMIALLHHYELMPASIYAYVPAKSKDAIQQPPTLHLLSSRIFTALSDATWRARETTAMEDAKKQGGKAMGLEAKGSSYRVRVSRVKPEIWLELILWSCLHGGWISDGARILRSVADAKEGGQPWTPISWRDSLRTIMPFDQEKLLDWDSIRYMFDTRSTATMDGVDVTGLRVDKTVSSEVVNAYIDALLDSVDVGVGNRGLSIMFVLTNIIAFRSFLQKANLNLGGGAWDAIMLRLAESGADIEGNPASVRRLVELSPQMGEELQSRRSQAIPSYVLDGSAATLGLLHRGLYAAIKKGELEGALKVFQLLQERVDNDRHRSLSDFFAHKHLSSTESVESSKGLFTSNFSGIDYPSFSTQIPPTTLAALLELVIENKAFQLGNWMLGIDSIDVDGPLIPASLYPDPHISAAIVHYATATKNSALLSKVTKLGAVQPEEGSNRAPTLPKELLQAFLNAQIELRRWDAAQKILEYMRDTDDFDWSVGNAAVLAKVMIAESKDKTIADGQSAATRATRLFASMLAGDYGGIRRPSARLESINTLCVVLSSVSPVLAAMVRTNNALPKHFNFTLRAGAFNSVLEGVVATCGSEAGRALIDRFVLAKRPEQPSSTDDLFAIREARNEDTHKDGEENAPEDGQDNATTPPRSLRMPRFMQDALAAGHLSRNQLSIVCVNARAATYTQEVAMYGGFTSISPTTVRIVVRQALAERANHKPTSQQPQPDDTLSLDIYVWALISLRRAGVDRSAVLDELINMENGLTVDEMRSVDRIAAEQWRNRHRRRGDLEEDASSSEEEVRSFPEEQNGSSI